MRYAILTAAIGIGATIAIDVWAIVRKHLLGVAPPDYRLVGRWIAYFPRGRFVHESIVASVPLRGEAAIGWAAHYLIGIAYAGLLVAIFGTAWIDDPAVGPAMIVGLGTVVAPFLLMQPCFGAGIAASRTPNPAAARVHSLVMHAIFGLGLYASAMAVHRFSL